MIVSLRKHPKTVLWVGVSDAIIAEVIIVLSFHTQCHHGLRQIHVDQVVKL